MPMMMLLRAGGTPMFFLLVFGLLALAAGVQFAWRPVPGGERVVAWLSRATLWATLVVIAADVAATLYHTGDIADPNERAQLTTQGLAESMSPAIIGFTVLALVSLLAAVGQRGCRAMTPANARGPVRGPVQEHP
jgi:hypothetical protein